MSFSVSYARDFAQQGYTHIPLTMVLSSDTLTPVAAFLKLRSSISDRSFLLESADGGEDVGRYSFIGLNPKGHLTLKSGVLEYEFDGERFSGVPRDPAGKISSILRKIRSPKIDGIPEFCPGGVGYVSYDYVRYLEHLPDRESPAGGYEVRMHFFSEILIFDRLKHRIFLIHYLPVSKAEDGYGYESAMERLAELKSRLFESSCGIDELCIDPDAPCDFEKLGIKPSVGRQRYVEAVGKIKKYIRGGDIFQCVLSDSFSFHFDADPFKVYRVLRMLNPSPYLFYLGNGDEFLAGSSPEMLIRSVNGNLTTSPIAGSRPRGMDRDEDLKLERQLMASVKEKAEHLMLVDLGRNDIGRVAKPGSVRVSEFMSIHRYSHVMHLVSRVEGRLLSGISPWQALGACFPAGTLSGAPKIRAMEIIDELEPSKRETYGGAVVAYDLSGNLNSCITIRSLHVKDGVGVVRAGAGIVADSRPEKEYDEVVNKAMAVLKSVSLARP
ncbi:MAG: chorismate-binding protein [Oligoflexales bacterium]|nr:chorismate-binding protein [Oligoflexales bacterium]